MDTPPIKRLTDLVQIATNHAATENEKRNAAMAACQLIANLDLMNKLQNFVDYYNNNAHHVEQLLRAFREGRVVILTKRR